MKLVMRRVWGFHIPLFLEAIQTKSHVGWVAGWVEIVKMLVLQWLKKSELTVSPDVGRISLLEVRIIKGRGKRRKVSERETRCRGEVQKRKTASLMAGPA